MRVKGFFIELNLRKKKWLLFCSYDPKYSQISYHFSKIGKALDYLTSNSDNIIVMGNFMWFSHSVYYSNKNVLQ